MVKVQISFKTVTCILVITFRVNHREKVSINGGMEVSIAESLKGESNMEKENGGKQQIIQNVTDSRVNI